MRRNRTICENGIALALAATLVMLPMAACSSGGGSDASGDAETTEEQVEATDVQEPEAGATQEADAEALPEEEPVSQNIWVVSKMVSQTTYGDEVTTETDTYTYDEHGNVTELTYSSAGIDYESEGTSTYEYDENGYCTSMSEVWDGEEFTYTFSYEYDELGRASKYISAEGKHVETYSYDDNNHITQLVTDFTTTAADDTVFDYHIVIDYDENGFVSGRTTTVNGETITYEYAYTYSDNGLPTSVVITANGEPDSTITYAYDADGNIIHEETTTKDYTTIIDLEYIQIDDPSLAALCNASTR
ncbi:MAG: hypothetical protein Q4D48_00040 [Coriobacteriales bacterium]|nr:hypothetical protein [Coriobacteriales bacterium]